MKTILIAEDEKFIRMGLKAMAQRAPVPVEEILEARDGVEALEILGRQQVDLLITDIRMPRMDGIELVKQLAALPCMPMVLVVSGYDDFNYAVAMLRNGVQDYLLKPVERQQFYEVLQKLEQRVLSEREEKEKQNLQYAHALRFLMLESGEESAGEQELAARYSADFIQGPYIGVCCSSGKAQLPPEFLRIRGQGREILWVVPREREEEVISCLPAVAGSSQVHRGLSDLRSCYLEARAAWQKSFFSRKPCRAEAGGNYKSPSISGEQLVGLVGLSREKEVSRLLWNQARAVTQGSADPEEFARLCADFVEGLCGTYKNILDSDDDPVRFSLIWEFDNAGQYLEELDAWLGRFASRISQEFADYEKKQKIRQAVQYVQEHFREPLSMTVVSNHVSMNYTLFSLLFKQYTGTNFVSYLQNLRIAETKRLLETTDWKVNEISRKAGFQDDKHFLKVFKASTGFSPTEYRKTRLLMEQKDI